MEQKVPNEQTSPRPWDYNPSAWNQRVKIALLALVAALIALYMGLYQWGLIDTVWDPLFGEQSQKVLSSDVSHALSSTFKLPDAILGFLAYLGDVIFALAGSTRRWQYRPWLVILFGIDVIPLGIVSAVLVFMQATWVGQWCFLCIITAIISLVLVAMAYDEVLSTLIYLKRLWQATKSWKVMVKTFWGFPTEEAYRVGLTMVTNERHD